MSTRSMVGMENPDGTITGIYVHFDGYLDGVGKTLNEYYQDADKVARLIALGDLSELNPEIGEQQDFDNSTHPDWCLAYGRDRGEEGIEARIYTDRADFTDASTSMGDGYGYLFTNGDWLVTVSASEFVPLADATEVNEGKEDGE